MKVCITGAFITNSQLCPNRGVGMARCSKHFCITCRHGHDLDFQDQIVILKIKITFVFKCRVGSRGEVEDTRLEAKAKDTKKNPRPRPRTDLSRPRTGMLEAKAKEQQGFKRKCSPKKKSSKTFFRRSSVKNAF